MMMVRILVRSVTDRETGSRWRVENKRVKSRVIFHVKKYAGLAQLEESMGFIGYLKDWVYMHTVLHTGPK